MFNKKKDAKALEAFIQNVYLAENLTIQESINNLEKSLIELIDYSSGKHIANGLLITENGYFLTNHHCIENLLDDNLTLIKNYKGEKYNILKVCKKK